MYVRVGYVVRCCRKSSTAERKSATMMFADFAVTLLIVAMTSYTCRSCQFPVYVQSSAAEAARRRDWRARSRSTRVAATSVRVVVDGRTLSWNELDRENDVRPMYVDRCQEAVKQVPGLYVVVVFFKPSSIFLGPNYKKIFRLSYEVIITYDNRKSNLR